MMIRLLFPSRIGKLRLYKERVLGLSIEGNTLYAASILIGMRVTKIEKLYKQELGSTKDVDVLHGHIERCLKYFSSIDAVRVVIPSSMVIFKELQVPFTDAEKITFVLPYEVEPLIPFALEDTTMSFVVNEVGASASKIFVAAARMTDIQNHLALYKESITPDLLTTDVMTLYAIFKQIPSYVAQTGLHCFIVLNEYITRIILVNEKGIKVTKNIYSGVGSIAEFFAQKRTISYEDALHILMQGFKTESLDEMIEKEWIAYIGRIQSIIATLLLQHEDVAHIAQTWCAGSYAHLPGLVSFFSTYLHVECKLFETEKIMENKHIVYQGNAIGSWTPYTNVLGALLPLPSQEHFSLASVLVKQKQALFLQRLWATALGIMCIVLCGIGGHSFYYVRQLYAVHDQLERREIALLRPLLQANNQKIPRSLDLKRAQMMAEAALKSKEEAWQELQKSGVSPLEVWYELTKLFDKNRFDVRIDSILISRQDGPLKADVTGIFRSKTGSDHFTHFADFEKRFSEAKILALDGLNESLTDDGSVQFNTLFKIREL